VVGLDLDLGPVRPLLVFGFLGLLPGTVVCRRLLPRLLDRGAVGLLVACATSIAVTAATAQLLVLLRAWVPERAVVALALLTLVHVQAPAARRRPDGAVDVAPREDALASDT
jgi:hypothetical protein